MDFSKLALEERHAYLESTAVLANKIKKHLRIGKSAKKLRQKVAKWPEFQSEDKDRALMITLRQYVYWNVTLDENQLILGYSASGFGDLIAVLGTDFSGQEIVQ